MHSLLAHPAVTLPLPGGDRLLFLSLAVSQRPGPGEADGNRSQWLVLRSLLPRGSPEKQEWAERQPHSPAEVAVLAPAVGPSPQLLPSLEQSDQPEKYMQISNPADK